MGNSSERCRGQREPSPLDKPNDYIPSMGYFVEYFHAGPDSDGPLQVNSTDTSSEPSKSAIITVTFNAKKRLQGETLHDTTIEIDLETGFRVIKIVETFEFASYEIFDFINRETTVARKKGRCTFKFWEESAAPKDGSPRAKLPTKESAPLRRTSQMSLILEQSRGIKFAKDSLDELKGMFERGEIQRPD